MKKKIFLFLSLSIISLIASSQISNTFIQKGKFFVSPTLRHAPKIENFKETWEIGGELAYMPLNRFEIRPGLSYYFGNSNGFEISMSSRFYLLKSKFTVFPEIYTSYVPLNKFFYYNYGLGIGYYGIFKRIGLDFIVRYESKTKFSYPDIRINILLGKIDK